VSAPGHYLRTAASVGSFVFAAAAALVAAADAWLVAAEAAAVEVSCRR